MLDGVGKLGVEVGAFLNLIRNTDVIELLCWPVPLVKPGGAVMAGMNVVKIGETNSDEGLRSPNVDFLVDNVVSSLGRFGWEKSSSVD